MGEEKAEDTQVAAWVKAYVHFVGRFEAQRGVAPIGAAAAFDFHEQGFMKVGQLVPPAAIRALREAALGMSPVAAPIYGMLTG